MILMIKKIFPLMAAIMIFMTATVFAEEEQQNTNYEYISRDYGYSIICPKRPNVVAANVFFGEENMKGEVLIFENVEYEVVRGWVVLTDAFDSNAVPNFNTDSKDVIDKYLSELQRQGYEGTALVNITKDNKGVLAITAKEIEIDEDGDGKADGVAITDRQEAITFFRTSDGKCYSVQLIGTAGLNEAAMNNFRKALTTFKENGATIQNESKDKNDKNDKKDKKDKKSKKDKKK